MAGKHGGLAVYPIGSVMRQTGLTGRQIRYYEQMMLIEPTRSKGNQRLYSDTDVEKLLGIKKLLDEGYNIEGIKALLTGESLPAEATCGGPSGETLVELADTPFESDVESFGLDISDDDGPGPDEMADSAYGVESAIPEISSAFVGGSKLVSLYPVNNRARLQNLLLSKHGRNLEEE